MATSLELFRALIPDAATVTDERVELLIEVAALDETPSVWGAPFQLAMVWKAGHLALMSPTDGTGASTGGGLAGSGGAITSKRTGDAALSYGSAASAASGGGGITKSDIDWALTHPGRQYLQIRERRAAGVPFVAEGALGPLGGPVVW